MAKRSNFERVERDYYQTPKEALVPLLPYLPESFTYAEPCAGDGRLIHHLASFRPNAECISASDISPDPETYKSMDYAITQVDALSLTRQSYRPDYIITNPPWSRDKKSGYLLHRMIETFSDIAPTWLLFDADWMHTVQSARYMQERCCKVVSIGRVKWIEGTTMTGKDNCCWYLFSRDARFVRGSYPAIVGRAA